MPLAPGTASTQQHAARGNPVATAQLEALETLTAAEADTLEAVVARLIPSDENGPGATEARAAHYIDRALTGPLRSSREAYAAGLAAIDAYAQSSKGAAFARLAAPDQDAVLTDLEKNVATGVVPNAATFFNLVRTHTIQGTFCSWLTSRDFTPDELRNNFRGQRERRPLQRRLSAEDDLALRGQLSRS
jgi:gluconate 2-dehydrogenase gamma chain